MSTPELVMRLVAMVLGVGIAALGGVLAWVANRAGREEGCLPYLLVIFGFLLAGAGFPSGAIFG